MRGAILAGAMAAVLAAPAQAGEQNRACHGFSEDGRGGSMTVTLLIDPQGRRLATSAEWLPAQADPVTSGSASAPDIFFTVAYPEGLERPALGLLVMRTMSPPDRRRGWQALDRELSRLTVTLSLGEAPAAPLALTISDEGEDLPLTASRMAWFAIPQGTSKAQVKVLGSDGATVRTLAVELDPERRSALYAPALREAETKAANFSTCELTD